MKSVSFALLLVSVTITGCAPSYSDKARFGVVYYCPGAGNTDFGDAGIRQGLAEAGYKGEVAAYVWTISFNVAIDQTLRFNAKARAAGLARIVEQYIDKYPDRPVQMVGLSAGTGVAIWALENMKDGYSVDNVVLLGSSLWHRYDVGKALRHVKGKIYVYYSSSDAVLAGPMHLLGTIDGVIGPDGDGAGAVGLHSKTGANRIVNTPWTPAFERFGYYGGHTDGTSPEFVRAVLARQLVTTDAATAREPRDGKPASQPASAPRAERPR